MFEWLTNTFIGVVVTELSGDIVFCNSKAKHILNIVATKRDGMSIYTYIPEAECTIADLPKPVRFSENCEIILERRDYKTRDEEYIVYYISDDGSIYNLIEKAESSNDDLEQLKVDVQMKDIQIDRKEYELQSMKDLIYMLAGLQDVPMIASKFVDYCFQHLLFSKGMFFQKVHDNQKITYHCLVHLPGGRRLAIDAEREWSDRFIHYFSETLSTNSGLFNMIDDQFRGFMMQVGVDKVKEVLTYPLVIGEREIGFFLFVTEEGHFGIEPEDLLLMEDLLQLVRPIFNNAILLEHSLTDELTTLKNRRMFDLSLNREIEFNAELGKEFSLLAIDIDRFKSINDRYGHAVGDQVIWSIGLLLKQAIRQHDSAFRYGGEEFMVLVTGGEEIANKVALRIQEAVRKLVIMLEGNLELKFTVSIGLAQYSSGLSATDFFTLSDKALYQSKHEGRDRITIASEALSQSA